MRHPRPPDTSRLQRATPKIPPAKPFLSWGLLSYFALVTLFITLTPFRFRWPSRLHFLWAGGWFDAVCNVLLFVPLGFLYWLARQPEPGCRLAHVFRSGLMMSAGIEITQLFLPGRYASPCDVLTNALGALLGAWLCDRAKHFLNQRWIGRLALELPLMNIVYLLIPLIWLNGLAAGSDWQRGYLSWFLGLSGSLVLVAVYRYGLEQNGKPSVPALACVAAGWFLTSSIPGFLESFSIPLLGCLLVLLAVCILLFLPSLAKSQQRRFEIPVLKQVFPLYIAYLLLLFLWPIPPKYVDWRGGLGFRELADEPGVLPILRLIEQFGAFTLLGYMMAEATGRREVSQTRSFGWNCFLCGLAAATLEGARGFHPEHTASLAQASLAFTGGVYGVIVYCMQLSSIQQLLGRQPQIGVRRRKVL